MKQSLSDLLAGAYVMRQPEPGLDAHAFVQSQGVGVPTGHPWTPHANLRADTATAIGRAGLSPEWTRFLQGSLLGHNGQEEIASPLSVAGYPLMPIADMTPAGYVMDGASDVSNGNYKGAAANALGAGMGFGALSGPGATAVETVGESLAPLAKTILRKGGEKVDDLIALKTARKANEQFNAPPESGSQYAWR